MNTEKFFLELRKSGLRFVSSLQLSSLVYRFFFPFNKNQRVISGYYKCYYPE